MPNRQAFDIQGLDGVLRKLQALPKEVTQKRGGPVRSSLRKGANVIRKQAQANVRRITATPNLDGGDESTGVLEKSIRVTRVRHRGPGNAERMRVGIPKSRRYPPSIKNPRGERVRLVGQRLEYGSTRLSEAHPWLGPAFHAKKMEAVTTIVRELNKGIDRIVKKLGAQP